MPDKPEDKETKEEPPKKKQDTEQKTDKEPKGPNLDDIINDIYAAIQSNATQIEGLKLSIQWQQAEINKLMKALKIEE